jgi:DNA (cytosine-5)-methyltransferase 1
METAVAKAAAIQATGSPFVAKAAFTNQRPALSSWLLDERLGGVIQHVSRAHMRSDLQRYFFASNYADIIGSSPKLQDFPDSLQPHHANAANDDVPFADRFRVQVWRNPASTVVAHMAKDGHYFIHPDPAQCRSLTVREAARLQSFPDNYFFEGTRTEQFTQVGNAVPPYLACQLARVVHQLQQSATEPSHRQPVSGFSTTQLCESSAGVRGQRGMTMPPESE